MENESIKAKILADYKVLLALKFDSPELILDKLKLIGEHIQQLNDRASSDTQANANMLIESVLSTEYAAFREAISNDDKEQALVQLKHKVAEACQLLSLHD